MDEKLKALQTYTQFHIGLYTGLLTLLVGAGNFRKEEFDFPFKTTLVLLALAGVCGGVVGSNAYEFDDLASFHRAQLGPFGLELFDGRTWTRLEHIFFWAAVVLVTASLVFPSCANPFIHFGFRAN